MRNILLMPPTVLVVDDEGLIRGSLSEMLGDRGYAVTATGDGRMALDAIAKAEKPFDVVLLDYRLPDSADLPTAGNPASRDADLAGHHDDGAQQPGSRPGGSSTRCLSRHQQAVRGRESRGVGETGPYG
jgi:hypothetical protein